MLMLRCQPVQKSLQNQAEVTLTPTLEVKDNDSAYDINKKAARYARRNGRLLFNKHLPHQAVVMPVAAGIT
ncbi:hypothetical protein HMPREF2712_08070 [Rothia sp. HMSC064F07]|nr:hypothetical protein HMPREF2712_08070 [Rothia sp. HMSC064F07]